MLENDVIWKTRDVRKFDFENKSYDLIVMTGLLHCYSTVDEIEQTVKNVKKATEKNRYNVISVLIDEFPNNNIKRKHSITRILAQNKRKI